MQLSLFTNLVWIWIGVALVLVPVQLFITAPYGRHNAGKKWGPQIDNRLGWILMEIVSPLCFSYFFLTGPVQKSIPMWIIFSLWVAHYLNRSLIFPFRIRTNGKKMPLAIVGSAAFFNLVNGFVNGYGLGHFGFWLDAASVPYPEWWLADPRFLGGFLLFAVGAGINAFADERLMRLRKPGETGYKVPNGWLFRFISCPNHFGEILEWTGFAILCWSLPALSFAIWTAANLIPRAISHHKWYRDQFGSTYPAQRKAVIPFVL